MTIEEIKELKKKSESQIMEIISRLEKESGCVVYSVNVVSEQLFGLTPRGLTNVDIKLNIE